MEKITSETIVSEKELLTNKLRSRIINSIKNCKNTISWDYHSNIEKNSISQKEWICTFVLKIKEASLNNTSGYDCIYCSAEVGAILRDLVFFKEKEELKEFGGELYRIISGDNSIGEGILEIGNLGGEFSIYLDNYLPAPICLLIKKDSLLNVDEEISSNKIIINNLL